MILKRVLFSILPLMSISLNAHANKLPHMPLDLSGYELEQMISHENPSILEMKGTSNFEDIFATGKRNLDWIRLLNQNRTEPISLSRPETQMGFPIENARIYNPEIIRESYATLKATMPESLRDVIFSTNPLPSVLPSSLEDYQKWGLEVDRTYQIALRWKMYEPYRAFLIDRGHDDVRGYYFITGTPGLLDQLKDWNSISDASKSQLVTWLNQVCRNDLRDIQRCQNLTKRAIQENKVYEFFNAHQSAGRNLMNEMMNIPNDGKFSKVTWTTKETFEVPFIDPVNQDMRNFLTDNIQTEWQFFPFSLQVLFVPENRTGVKVIWEPGVVPHVPSLGSSLIYMDANAPISQYDVQWTIRHEFGHVLGFPDCYIEFYDEDVNGIVSYQIDTNDLMCSRRGHLKSRHVSELRRVYK